MAIDTTLRGALRRFGLDAATHIGAPWTYTLPSGDVVHLCWREGTSIQWSTASGVMTYRDTFADFDPTRPGLNALQSFDLLQSAQAQHTPIRCILVGGDKQTGTRYTARPELVGEVTLAVAQPGQGIEISFRKQ